ncbi:alpha-acetolactate decarboxylase, partial [Lacticaseibacillus rhamnosus MTCC 5462]
NWVRFLPDLYAGAVSPGFHVHFLAADHSMGGHILGFELDSGELFYKSLATSSCICQQMISLS